MRKLLYFMVLLAWVACTKNTPKPKGYFRIEIAKTDARLFSPSNLPYQFLIPANCVLKYDSTGNNTPALVISYPRYHAQLLCHYQSITKSSFRSIAEESRQFVYRHSVKADAINEKLFDHSQNRVYGIFYELKGNVATPLQFSLTDSTKHFFRGALYFDCVPKADSLAPVVKYIKANVLEIMQTFQWK